MRGQVYVVGALFIALSLIALYGYVSVPEVSYSHEHVMCQHIFDAWLNNASIADAMERAHGSVFIVRNGTRIVVFESYPGAIEVEINNTWYVVNSNMSLQIGGSNFTVYVPGYSFGFLSSDYAHLVCGKKHFYMRDE